jgi:hypothetical protein
LEHNLKYHSIKDLEALVNNLSSEIEHLEKTQGKTTLQEASLKEDISLKHAAELEIMERTLLGASNDGGCSD